MAGVAVSGDTFSADLFAGQTALVTGSGRGIGAGVAENFARLGARVVLHDLDAGMLEAKQAELRRAGFEAEAVRADLTRAGAAEALFAKALNKTGAIHILVNNAGRSWGVATEAIEPIRTQELIELNLKAVLVLSQRFVVHAKERGGGGAIVQVSSTAGITGFEQRAVYCATKFGVVGLTKVLALDHARHGIRVNAVLPHVVETDMFRTVAQQSEAKRWAEGIPMGRFATVREVADVVAFLCSPAAAYLTGGLYPVDGGAMAGSFGAA
jgi:NAD(P)-dependent dehydrogenase (short-subunit alcohol dehydrogenase family)